MHPVEIINFAVISSKTRRIAEMMSLSLPYSLDIHIENEPVIILYGPKYSSCFAITADLERSEKIDDYELDGKMERRVFKFSADIVQGWEFYFNLISGIFKNQSINVLWMYFDSFPDQNKSITDLLKSKPIDVCYASEVRPHKYREEDVTYFLNNITINHSLDIAIFCQNRNFDVRIQENLDLVVLKEAEWLTIEKLLEIDALQLIIREHRLKIQEWNLFMKRWIAMETHLNLKYLDFDFGNWEEFTEKVLADIPHEVIDRRVSRLLVCHYNGTAVSDEGYNMRSVNGGIDIKRRDGTTATFFMDVGDWSFVVAMSVH